jgi:hypothetical protein
VQGLFTDGEFIEQKIPGVTDDHPTFAAKPWCFCVHVLPG